MAGRLIEVFLPTERLELARSSISGLMITSMWTERLSETHSQLHILTDSASSEKVTEEISSALADTIEDIRIICLPVEASIPEEKSSGGMISYDELKQDIVEMTSPSSSTWILTLLSAVVAAAGLYRNSATILIGAMVIAPLLGPSVGLSLSLVHQERRLFGISLREMIIRSVIAVVFSALLGMTLKVDPALSEITSRIQSGPSDIVLALASGAAGAIALCTGGSSTLIGVMVAVALMPPLVTAGLLWGGGYSGWQGGLSLFALNLACIVVSGALVFTVRRLTARRQR
ncbi:MAG: TIGR00341 family protein [Gemmatimonadaceae bacterium 4484_173]|nr:MAG: TIGR00341 family protein [Gemmatimonadaceae bacterium 4484_173]RKZ03205.1 MAG: TIGR00341 family protein [Candidatus Fermentibacteria bacterium]